MYQRKKVFVSSTIQGRLVGQLGFYWLLYTFLLWHATYLIETMSVEGVPEPIAISYTRFCSQHLVWLLCMVGGIPIILWDMIKMTHRVAGPLVRLERVVRDMACGKKVEPIVLRPNDMLGHFVDTLNELITVHNQRLDEHDAAENDWEARTAEPAAT